MAEPYYTDDSVTLWHGDCLDVLAELPDASVDAVVTDPPYGLSFMGKAWDRPAPRAATACVVCGDDDPVEGFTVCTPCLEALGPAGDQYVMPVERHGGRGMLGHISKNWHEKGTHSRGYADNDSAAFQAWCEQWAAECLRVLKPGGHMLAFGGSRTWHRLACAVEDAGFEIRDSIAWLYGSGFPKSLDVSKAIDKRRHDGADIRRVTAWIAATRTAAGVTNRDIDAAFGFNGMAGHWTTQGPQAAIPTLDQVPALLAVLGVAPEDVPDEIRALLIDLNGRKGQPGEAWFQREVIQERTMTQGGGTSLQIRMGEAREVRADITAPATPDAARWQGWGTALKPGHEPVCVAVKPHATADILAEIGSHLDRLEAEWKRAARGAARRSAPTPAGSPAAKAGSAPASAATPPADEPETTTPTGEAGGSSAPTATSASEWTDETFSNTVTSWRACLAALSDLTSTSTTATATRPTTDLRTLWSSIASLTVTSTPGSPTPTLTGPCPASVVDDLFAATVLSSRATLALSAPASATDSTPTSRQGEAGRARSHFEPIVVARKPLAGTVAANVLAHGTGALNIDATRVGYAPGDPTLEWGERYGGGKLNAQGEEYQTGSGVSGLSGIGQVTGTVNTAGRWPTNVVLDESQAAELDRQSGVSASRKGGIRQSSNAMWGRPDHVNDGTSEYDDEGGASRFFPTFRYEAKAPTEERPRVGGTAHPTVKPLDLMRWLVRLVTPPGGTVLEPFAGSGTTAEACVIEGFQCIAIEREADYLPLIVARLTKPIPLALDLGATP